MPYEKIGLSTVCRDTPANRWEFEQFCKQIASPCSKKNDTLSRQISKENKELRGLRTFLPGYEPDR